MALKAKLLQNYGESYEELTHIKESQTLNQTQRGSLHDLMEESMVQRPIRTKKSDFHASDVPLLRAGRWD